MEKDKVKKKKERKKKWEKKDEIGRGVCAKFHLII